MNSIEELIPTRHSLLSRLKNWDDHESWKVFFDTYWRLLYSAAIKAGLSDSEAQDAVQETVISVMKSIPDFHYNKEKGEFKGWLLRLTRWRILDQMRKRDLAAVSSPQTSTKVVPADGLDELSLSIPPELQEVWDKEWEENLMEAALERVKKKVDPRHYQVFDLLVFKKWSVLRVSRSLHINAGRIYLLKHRIGNLVKKELQQLREKPM